MHPMVTQLVCFAHIHTIVIDASDGDSTRVQCHQLHIHTIIIDASDGDSTRVQCHQLHTGDAISFYPIFIKLKNNLNIYIFFNFPLHQGGEKQQLIFKMYHPDLFYEVN